MWLEEEEKEDDKVSSFLRWRSPKWKRMENKIEGAFVQLWTASDEKRKKITVFLFFEAEEFKIDPNEIHGGGLRPIV